MSITTITHKGIAVAEYNTATNYIRFNRSAMPYLTAKQLRPFKYEKKRVDSILHKYFYNAFTDRNYCNLQFKELNERLQSILDYSNENTLQLLGMKAAYSYIFAKGFITSNEIKMQLHYLTKSKKEVKRHTLEIVNDAFKQGQVEVLLKINELIEIKSNEI